MLPQDLQVTDMFLNNSISIIEEYAGLPSFLYLHKAARAVCVSFEVSDGNVSACTA